MYRLWTDPVLRVINAAGQAFEELAHSREQIRELKMHVRQLTEELEASSRYVSSSDRIRSTYGRPPGSR